MHARFHRSNFRAFYFLLLSLGLYVAGCTDSSGSKNKDDAKSFEKGSYGYDAAFLKEQPGNMIELSTADSQSRILLSPAYQGRVMTSTASGDTGTSFGWINYDLIKSGSFKKQFNPMGGEERFWLGPEGGQYALYFKKGDSMNINYWQVPGIIDTSVYPVSLQTPSSVTFTKTASLANYAGTGFNVEITRKISLLDKAAVEQKINGKLPPSVDFVAFQSENSIKNTGTNAWTKDKGLLSIWLLGMFTPSENAVVIIPYKGSAGSKDKITDDYFGKIPANRLIRKDSVLFFVCDGKMRGKIGIPPGIAKPVAVSYDFDKNVLTCIFFSIDENGDYVNSKWEVQKQPYKGDVLNAYNDGPLADGSQLGPFYEIESSSPAKELKPGETQQHSEVTAHFQGDPSELDALLQKLTGATLSEVRQSLTDAKK